MSTVLIVDTYAAISDFLPAMWPHYQKAGVDIVGIERTNAPTRWPCVVPHFAIGEDYFKVWADFQGDPLLCNRWLSIIELFLREPSLAKYDDACLIEWDVMFVRPLPKLDPIYKLSLTMAGGQIAGWKAPYFFHPPWWMTRQRAEMLLGQGRVLMERGDFERGSPDLFLGLIVHELGLPWCQLPWYTTNRIDHPTKVEAAKFAIRNGAYGVHGVRDVATLNEILTAC